MGFTLETGVSAFTVFLQGLLSFSPPACSLWCRFTSVTSPEAPKRWTRTALSATNAARFSSTRCFLSWASALPSFSLVSDSRRPDAFQRQPGRFHQNRRRDRHPLRSVSARPVRFQVSQPGTPPAPKARQAGHEPPWSPCCSALPSAFPGCPASVPSFRAYC